MIGYGGDQGQRSFFHPFESLSIFCIVWLEAA